jgi:hypothetical protein
MGTTNRQQRSLNQRYRQTADSSEEVGRIEPRNGSPNNQTEIAMNQQQTRLPASFEAQFARVFAANEPKRIETRIYADGARITGANFRNDDTRFTTISKVSK